IRAFPVTGVQTCALPIFRATRFPTTCAACSSEPGAPRRYTCAMAITTTLAAEASLQQEIRKSRFLARAAPVQSPEDAAAFIAREIGRASCREGAGRADAA